MRQLRRVIVVTLGLSMAGAVAVGACAAVVAVVLQTRNFGVAALRQPDSARLVGGLAAWGAVAGGVAVPLLAWLLLRRVALGRAIGGTALGGLLGAVAGEYLAPLSPYDRHLPGFLAGALVGFAATGVLLRVASSRGSRATAGDAAG